MQKEKNNGVRASQDEGHYAVTTIKEFHAENALRGLSPNNMTRSARVAVCIG